MRSPDHWWHDPETPGLAARLLSPLGALYAAGTARRLARGTAYRPGVPVICVGNLTAGGTGKTPAVIALAERLLAGGWSPAAVSRGHGGRLEGPVAVDPARHKAADVGDEPLLLSAFLPVTVARDRAAGARAGAAAGANVLLLDDGFQNPSVAKDLSLIVVDAATGFGNGRPIPAGPLREPVGTGLARAHLVLSIGPAPARATFREIWGTRLGRPLVEAELTPLRTGMDWHGVRVLAFAGIGRPEKFFATLRDLGADVVRAVPLADHQPLSDRLLTRILGEAAARGLQPVTTEKDAVRLPQHLRARILTLPVRLRVATGDAALSAALAALPKPRPG